MANQSPKLGTDLPNSSIQQQSLTRRQPDFAANSSLTEFPPPNQPNLARPQPRSFTQQNQPSVAFNQPTFVAHHQPGFAHAQPNFPPYNQQQPNLAPPLQRQPSFAAHRQLNRPADPSDFSRGEQQQQKRFLAANQIALYGHPQFPDQSLILSNNPSQAHFPTSTNPIYVPASGYQSLSPSSHPRGFAQSSSRQAYSNHPRLFNPHQGRQYQQRNQQSNQQGSQQHNQQNQHQQHQHNQHQQHHSRTSNQESILTCKPSPLMPVPLFIPSGANRRVTNPTSAADAARRQEAMQTNLTAASDDGPSSYFNGAREIHNAIRQVNETLNVIRNEMVVMHEHVNQNIFAMHRENYAIQERNNGNIERVIKILNYSERNNLARTMNSTITSQSQLLEPLLTSDGVRPEGFPVDILALNKLDIHQVTALCELYSLGLTGGMEEKMQRLRMFIGIERAYDS